MKRKEKVVFIAVGDIMPNPNQPRSFFDDAALCALADSIRQFGVIQPIAVKKRSSVPHININGQSVSGPCYEIIAGERRWRAAKKIGLAEVPCRILACNPEKSAYLAFSENVFREDLSFFDVAAALQDMLAKSAMTQTELAAKLSISQSAIANKLRLLKLEPAEREEILRAHLTERHARAFIRIDDERVRRDYIRKAVLLGWSAKDTDRKINAYLSSPEVKAASRKFRGKRIGAISDIGVFINSIDSAVRMVRDVGVEVVREDVDRGDSIEIIIKVPKARRQAGVV